MGPLGREISPSQDNTYKEEKRADIHVVGFEHTISVIESMKVLSSLDRAATVIGN
jgi:hypothetical protein